MKINDFDGVKNLCGERVYQARTARHMTQQELAAKMQVQGVAVEREAISKIETGRRLVTDYELAAFARVFNVSLEWLLQS